MTPPHRSEPLSAAPCQPPPASPADAAAFLHLVAHDLRAPVAAVRTMVSLLTQRHLGELRPPQAEILDRIERRLESLQALLDDLLDLAALRAAPPTPGPSDLRIAAREACSRAEARVRARGGSLAIQGGADPVSAAIGGADLELVLHHLIDNAVKYGGGGVVTVTVEPAEGHGRLTITDAGIGIPAAARPRLFTPLFRAPNAEALAPGSGLGLLIVKEAVERCGGTLAIESIEGQGTTVEVRLPAAPADPRPGT